jgi:pimeloyl-ACP methyl ester carboxylesterase
MSAPGGYVVSTSVEHAPLLRYHLFAPVGPPRGAPVVLVHGTSSDPAEQFRAFLPLAYRHQVVLIVPEFTRPAFRGYQRLAGAAGPLAAASALDAVVAEAAGMTGAPISAFDLVGFSGGAQFAHRYAMLFPSRVRRLVAASAGWYTWLGSSLPFPEGPHASLASGHTRVRIAEFLRIPIRVMVGERDVARDRRLRVDPRIDAEQGAHRLERALRWVEHLAAVARSRGCEADATIELLPDTGHLFRQAMQRGGFGERALEFLASDRASGGSAGAKAVQSAKGGTS